MMRLLIAATALLSITPALAAEDAAKPAKPKMVCRSAEPATGSRMGVRRVCKTAADWEASRRAVQRDMDDRARADYNQTRATSGLF